VDGDFAVFKSGEFAVVIVDQNDVVAEVGEACAGDQSHVSGTDDSNPHDETPEGANKRMKGFARSKMR